MNKPKKELKATFEGFQKESFYMQRNHIIYAMQYTSKLSKKQEIYLQKLESNGKNK